MREDPRIRGIQQLFRLTGRHASVEEDVDDEIRFHLDSRVEELVASGISPELALVQARQEFGDVIASRRELRSVDRGQRGRAKRTEWLDGWNHDIRFALRSLRRQPGFSAVIVLTLALAIGANAMMFGIVDRLFLRGPSLVHDSGRLLRAYSVMKATGSGEVMQSQMGYVDYTDLRAGVRDIAGVGAYAYEDLTVGHGEEAHDVRAAYATWDLFPLLGVRAALGRFFGAAEDRPPKGLHVVALDEGYWRRRYGGDPKIVGQTLEIDEERYTIVGVAPRGFTGVELRGVDIWLPMSAHAPVTLDWPTTRMGTWLQVVGRLKPGVSAGQASSAATTVHRRASQGGPELVAKAGIALLPLLRGPNGTELPEVAVARWLAGVAAIVLLIACANTGNLLLARATRRRREIAVRLALGVSRTRLQRLLFTEAMFLAGLGGGAAVILAYFGAPILRALLLPGIAWDASPVNGAVLAFTGLAIGLTGILTGMVPASQASRPDLTAALKAGAREGGPARSRLRDALLVLQPALSVVLLIGAGLFIESLHKVLTLDLGIEPDRVLAVAIMWPSSPEQTFEGRMGAAARHQAFLAKAIVRLRAAPWVDQASEAIGTPFHSAYGVGLSVPGVDTIPQLPGGGPYVSAVSDGYFETVGTRLVRGRVFTTADHEGSERVVIVNATMARVLWPNGEALNKCLHIFALENNPCFRVVGVVGDARRWRLKEEPAMQYYVPLGQERSIGGTTLLVRPRNKQPERAAGLVENELRRLAPDLPLTRIQVLQQALDPQVRPWRVAAELFSLFGLLALVVAAMGLYSVIAYIVEQRTPEFGVRIALGASSRAILRSTLWRGVVPAAAGLVIGVLIALAGGGLLEPLLFETSAQDPRIFAGVTIFLILVSAAASFVPAWRATLVDPVTALRSE